MKRLAIFTEGQSELIFVRHLLPLILGWEKISFECFRLWKDRMDPVPFKYQNENAKVYFFIVNVGNDGKVLTFIKEREQSLSRGGYEKIIALRDMYSKEYCNRAGCSINGAITEEFINGAHEAIQGMGNSDKIKMHFAIMELEAWFLGMYNIFRRVKPELTIAYIEEKLGFNLAVIDPQTEFFKPADIVDNILQLVDWPYQKSEHDIESLCSKMDTRDFSNILENGRCISFKDFCDEILN